MLSWVCSGNRGDNSHAHPPLPSQTGGDEHRYPLFSPGARAYTLATREGRPDRHRGRSSEPHTKPRQKEAFPYSKLKSRLLLKGQPDNLQGNTPYLPLIHTLGHFLCIQKCNMKKAADIQKQCKFSKYKVSSEILTTLFTIFTKEKWATFRTDGTKVATGPKPERMCLELTKVY